MVKKRKRWQTWIVAGAFLFTTLTGVALATNGPFNQGKTWGNVSPEVYVNTYPGAWSSSRNPNLTTNAVKEIVEDARCTLNVPLNNYNAGIKLKWKGGKDMGSKYPSSLSVPDGEIWISAWQDHVPGTLAKTWRDNFGQIEYAIIRINLEDYDWANIHDWCLGNVDVPNLKYDLQTVVGHEFMHAFNSSEDVCSISQYCNGSQMLVTQANCHQGDQWGWTMCGASKGLANFPMKPQQRILNNEERDDMFDNYGVSH